MLTITSLFLAAVLSSPTAAPLPDEGQGTAQPGSILSQLRPGTHLLGPAFRPGDQLGKVVVVKIGGS